MWAVLAIGAEAVAGASVGPTDLFGLPAPVAAWASAPDDGPPVACEPAAPGVERCLYPVGPRSPAGDPALPAPAPLGARWNPASRLAPVDPATDGGALGTAASRLAVRVGYGPARPEAPRARVSALLPGRLAGTLPLSLPGGSGLRSSAPPVRLPTPLAGSPEGPVGARVEVAGSLAPPPPLGARRRAVPETFGGLVRDGLTGRARLPAWAPPGAPRVAPAPLDAPPGR